MTTTSTSPRARDPYRLIGPLQGQELRELYRSGMTVDELCALYALDYANVLRVLRAPDAES